MHTGGIWDVERKPVAFAFDSGLRYYFNASHAWRSLVPGDGLVHLGAHREPFMVSMFHQLRCLDALRAQLAAITDGARTVPLSAGAEFVLVIKVRFEVGCRAGR